MKTLISVLPWWSAVLLFGNIAGSFSVLWLRQKQAAFPALTMFRLFILYSGLGGIAGLLALCLSPIGSWYFWYTVGWASLIYDVMLFLLCAQVIDHAIHRKSVEPAKALWLTLCPTVLGIVIAWNHIYPLIRMRQTVKFDLGFAVTCGAVLVFAIQKPRDLQPNERWDDHSRIIGGLTIQLVAMCAMPFFRSFPSIAADVLAPLSSLGMLGAFALATVKKNGVARIES